MKAGSTYNQKIITLLKFILLPVTVGFVVYKLFYAYRINRLFEEVPFVADARNFLLLAAVLLLMLANWALETWKWKIQVTKNEPVHFYDALKGVIAGVTLSMITPNQLGDFVGRIIYLKKTDKIKGALLAVIGHTAQVIMTVAFGALGLLALLSGTHYVHGHLVFAANILLLALIPLAVYLYINMGLLSRFPVHERVRKYLDVFAQYSGNELSALLILSFTRYMVFVLQYYLLTLVFRLDVEPLQALICITSTIFIQSFVPSFILVEIGMRGASALFIFGFFSRQVVPVLLTTYVVWIVNILLPGLAGLFFLMKWRSARA